MNQNDDITQHAMQSILKANYGIDAKPVGVLEKFGTSPSKYLYGNRDYFELQKFETNSGELYNLVNCLKDFPNNKELFEFMQEVEYLDVRSYELLDTDKPVRDYFLYKLIPHTVQGKPVWL